MELVPSIEFMELVPDVPGRRLQVSKAAGLCLPSSELYVLVFQNHYTGCIAGVQSQTSPGYFFFYIFLIVCLLLRVFSPT
eukprot:SAG11_NODE_5299_length_1602_cov_20.691284_1_plen_80_part_00